MDAASPAADARRHAAQTAEYLERHLDRTSDLFAELIDPAATTSEEAAAGSTSI
jgi:hypothetical protein